MTTSAYPYPESLMHYVQRLFQLIEEARQGAFERHDSEFGDDAQVLGIRAYKNFVKTIEGIKGSAGWEWLRAAAPKGRLTLQIIDEEHGNILLRVWRADDPEQDAEEKRMLLAKESESMQELFPTSKGIIDRWGLVYQTDSDRLAETGYLIGYSSETKQSIAHFEIPRGQISGTVADMDKFPEPVEIVTPKPAIRKFKPVDVAVVGK